MGSGNISTTGEITTDVGNFTIQVGDPSDDVYDKKDKIGFSQSDVCRIVYNHLVKSEDRLSNKARKKIQKEMRSTSYEFAHVFPPQ